ncbi:hypothetical protein [Pseudomonas zhanjiangensis]|uniref:Uncharacterized protein n=1 Tax=Pseudomonas zhanjiangensis TaxID=3239015 RepID=A0ABV3YYK5_9PSED
MELLYVIIGVPTFLLLTAAIGIPITKHLDRKMAAKMEHVIFKGKIRKKH